MGKIVSITNQKGGVGKTTTAVNLSSYLALLNKKTLLIDLDPQGNTTSGLGIDKSKLKATIFELLTGESSVQDVIIPTMIKNLFLIPSDLNLNVFKTSYANAPRKEFLLKEKVIDRIKENFDYIIIDCPPSIDILTLNALTAADEVIVPIQSEFYALEGIAQFSQLFELVKKNLNPNLKLRGVVITMYDTRTKLSKDVEENVRKFFGGKVFKTVIPRNVRLSEAPSYGVPIPLYAPSSPGAEAYKALTEEIIKGDEK